jgi:hypothetical protein
MKVSEQLTAMILERLTHGSCPMATCTLHTPVDGRLAEPVHDSCRVCAGKWQPDCVVERRDYDGCVHSVRQLEHRLHAGTVRLVRRRVLANNVKVACSHGLLTIGRHLPSTSSSPTLQRTDSADISAHSFGPAAEGYSSCNENCPVRFSWIGCERLRASVP